MSGSDERFNLTKQFAEEDAQQAAEERIVITEAELVDPNAPPSGEPLGAPRLAPKEIFTPGEVADIIIEERIAPEGLGYMGASALKPLVKYAHPDNKQGLIAEEPDARVAEEISKRVNAAYDNARRSESQT